MKELAYAPKHSADEVVLGLFITLAVHLVPVALVVLHVVLPAPPEKQEEALVAKPVIAASLLKLGKIDPSKLPDRLKPIANQAPKKDALASQNDPQKKLDAGAPPNARDSDHTERADKNDLFAEDGGRRLTEGNPNGVEGGLETDPSKVHAGDMYALKLGTFIRERWSIPSVISQGDASKLCVVYQVNIGPRMVIWYLRSDPIKKSGNDLFDDSARAVLQKLLDDKTALPEPPPEVEGQFRSHTVQLLLSGDMHGDASQCTK